MDAVIDYHNMNAIKDIKKAKEEYKGNARNAIDQNIRFIFASINCAINSGYPKTKITTSFKENLDRLKELGYIVEQSDNKYDYIVSGWAD